MENLIQHWTEIRRLDTIDYSANLVLKIAGIVLVVGVVTLVGLLV